MSYSGVNQAGSSAPGADKVWGTTPVGAKVERKRDIVQATGELHEYCKSVLPSIEDSIQEQIESLNSMIVPVASHILNSGGKRLRPLLCILVAAALGRRDSSVYPLASAIEMVHSATLLHDDILDNAEMRRGKKAAHLVFGVRETILAGDALLAQANRIVSQYRDTELVDCLSEAISSTAAGEILEIQKMANPDLNKEEYLEIIKGKTAYLIQASCEGGAILSESDLNRSGLRQRARNMGLNLGIAFQLVDDALDYTPSPELGKPQGSDLREGKITLPMIYFLNDLDYQERTALVSRIKNGSLGESELDSVMNSIQERMLHDRTRSEADFYIASAYQELNGFPASREKVFLGQMLEYLRCREN